jgi:uncharacterized protein (DUF305 family)
MLNVAEPFDRAFIDMMVSHHEGAVAMAEQLLEDGEHRNLRAIAQDIISAQTREIASMKRWPKAWYGSARVPTDMNGHGSKDDMHMGG